MAEAEGRQTAGEVEAKEEGDGEPQTLEGRMEDRGDSVTVTVDSVVEAFFASEVDPESGGAGKGQRDEEWSSEEEDTEARGQRLIADRDQPVAVLTAAGDADTGVSDGGKPPQAQQEAVAEAELGPEETERYDGEEVSSDVERSLSPGEEKEEDDRRADSADHSFDAGGHGEGRQRKQESCDLAAAPAQASTDLPANNTEGTEQGRELEHQAAEDRDETAAGLDRGLEADVVSVEEEPKEPGRGGQQGVEAVAEGLVQLVLDRAVQSEAGADRDRAVQSEADADRDRAVRSEADADRDRAVQSEAGADRDSAGARQEADAQLSELDRMEVHSESWGSEGPGSDDDADLDREQDLDKLPSDAEQTAAVGGEERDEETGSEAQPCEGERELQGESQQLYHYASDQSPPPSPQSPGGLRDVQQLGGSSPGQDSEERPSPKAQYPLNVDNYKVCRMLSPGLKECLILETGEQIVYECDRRDITGSKRRPASQPNSHTPSPADKEKVKRNLYRSRPSRRHVSVSDSAPESRQQDTAPAPSDAASSPSEHPSPPGHPPPQQSPTPASSQLPGTDGPHRQGEGEDSCDRPGEMEESRDGPGQMEESRDRPGQMEESHDGSYLWLQRQVQWRAGSSQVPEVKGTRESVRVERHETSGGYGGWREERSGEGGRQSVSGDDRLGTSTEVSGSLSSPGAIPNFNTLRDQQVSWLSMYRMLEDQHRRELQNQHSEHQQLMEHMQHQLEGRLLAQQENMRHKLDSHRQALKESYSSHSGVPGSSSRLTKHSDTTTLPLPSSDPSSPRQSREADGKGRSSQHVSRDTARSSPEVSREKRLRGGVYSSPMPTAKCRASSRERASYEGDSEERYTSSLRSDRRTVKQEEDYSSSQHLSPRSQQTLREKHAKHLSDLRSYYEAEIADLRQKLGAEGLRLSSSLSSATAAGRDRTREGLLQEENQMLRLQLRDLQDSLHDAQIHSRDLEQKLQGLEIRATDYGSRYEESQSTVLKLKNRLEELHSYAKDREAVLEQVTDSQQRQAATLQDMCQRKEDLEETARRDASTIKRLIDKYEMLEKDYASLKETCADFEQRLFETRSETVQLNKTVSQLELENKRLTHDNDNMRHRLAVSGSLPLTRQELSETGPHRVSYETLNGYAGAGSAFCPLETHSARSRDASPPRRAPPEEDALVVGKSDSPLLRAERELRRLQQTLEHGDFIPHLQPKRYTQSLGPASGEVTVIDAFSSPARSGNSVDAGLKDGRGKKATVQPSRQERGGGGQSKAAGRCPQKPALNGDSGQPSGVSSPTRFDVGVVKAAARSPSAGVSVGAKKARGRGGGERKDEPKPSSKSAAKGGDSHRVDATLERVRSGEFVSRPQWEDVYTSLAKPAHSDKPPAINMTQEEMLRDRMRSIDQMERRYDNLQVEKRKLESQLNKAPTHGRDRKSRREKELLEEKLDSVDHELGSLRMTLKRYQVLKTTM